MYGTQVPPVGRPPFSRVSFVVNMQDDKKATATASAADVEELESLLGRLASPAFLDAISAARYEPADFEKDEVCLGPLFCGCGWKPLVEVTDSGLAGAWVQRSPPYICVPVRLLGPLQCRTSTSTLTSSLLPPTCGP